MNLRKRSAALFVTILALVAISRGALWTCMTPGLRARYSVSGTDYKHHYLPVAESIAAGEGFTLPGTGRLDTRYPPGYPTYLAGGLVLAKGFGWSIGSVRIALDNLVVVPLTILGLFALWRKLGLSLPWAALAALAFAVYPPYVWASLIPSPVPLFTLLLVWTCVAWGMMIHQPLRLRWYCAFGAGLGLSMLVHPTPVLLPFVALSVLLLRRARWTHVLWAAACGVAVVGPWIIAASIAEQSFVLLSTGGFPSLRDGMSRFPENAVARAFMADFRARGSLPAAAVFSVQQMFIHPLSSLSLWVHKLLRACYATDAGGRIEWVLAATNLPLFVLGGVGWLQCMRGTRNDVSSRRLNKDAGALLVYFWLVTALVASIFRYMLPVMWISIGYSVVLGRAMLVRGWHGPNKEATNPQRSPNP